MNSHWVHQQDIVIFHCPIPSCEGKPFRLSLGDQAVAGVAVMGRELTRYIRVLCCDCKAGKFVNFNL